MNHLEKREKEIFDETQEKQAKFARKMLLGMLGTMGFLFAIFGACWLAFNSKGNREMGTVFLFVGLGLISVGILLFLVIPTKYNYTKYKARVQKYGYINIYGLASKVCELEARIEELEKEIKEKQNIKTLGFRKLSKSFFQRIDSIQIFVGYKNQLSS